MPAVGDLLRVLQFGDSMFPVGAFSFSNGLESAIETGVVHDGATLHDFLRTATHQAASGDGIALLECHRATVDGDPARVERADRAAYVRRLNEEMRTMSVRMGRKLVEAGVRVTDRPAVCAFHDRVAAGATPGTYPAGLGVLFAALDLPEADAFAVHQNGVAVMMVGAALRLMRLHHLDAQAVLYRVNASVADDYDRVRSLTPADMSAFAPLTDILAAVHVTAHVRMFMN
jgi:urease accessory protein